MKVSIIIKHSRTFTQLFISVFSITLPTHPPDNKKSTKSMTIRSSKYKNSLVINEFILVAVTSTIEEWVPMSMEKFSAPNSRDIPSESPVEMTSKVSP